MSAPVVSSTIAPGAPAPPRAVDEPDVIAVGDEADLLGVGLVGVGQPGPPRQRPHVVLAHVAQRKPDARQKLGSDAEEKVRLVLAAVAGAAEHDAAVVGGREPGVVSGRERRRADGVGERQQRPELQLLVAAHARVRRLTRAVAGDEVVDHRGLKRRALVDHVMSDSKMSGRRARVLDVARPTAPPADAGGRAGRVIEAQGRADDLVSPLGQQRRRGGRIHAARHRDDDPLPLSRRRRLLLLPPVVVAPRPGAPRPRQRPRPSRSPPPCSPRRSRFGSRIPPPRRQPQRPQHLGGRQRSRGARRTRRHADAIEIERRRDELPRRAGETDVQCSGQPLRAVAVAAGSRNREQPRLQSIAQHPDTRRGGREVGSREAGRDAEADDAAHVLGPGAALPLLMPARGQRRERHTATDVRGAHALRSVELVRRQRQRVDPQPVDGDLQLAGCLHGVGVEQGAGVVRHARERRDVIDIAQLVIGERQRDQHGIRPERGAERVRGRRGHRDRRRRR